MKRNQTGALSLGWCMVMVLLGTALLFAGLFSFRYGRNLFAEGWAYSQSALAGHSVQSIRSEATAALKWQESKGQETTLRKCKINGAVVYSNVDCGDDNPTTQKVASHISQGIESPKVPVVVESQFSAPDDARQKMLDKAIEKATGN